MRKSKFSEAKRLAILAEHDKGDSVESTAEITRSARRRFTNGRSPSPTRKTITNVASKSSSRKMPASRRCTPS